MLTCIDFVLVVMNIRTLHFYLQSSLNFIFIKQKLKTINPLVLCGYRKSGFYYVLYYCLKVDPLPPLFLMRVWSLTSRDWTHWRNIYFQQCAQNCLNCPEESWNGLMWRQEWVLEILMASQMPSSLNLKQKIGCSKSHQIVKPGHIC